MSGVDFQDFSEKQSKKLVSRPFVGVNYWSPRVCQINLLGLGGFVHYWNPVPGEGESVCKGIGIFPY